MAVVCCVSVLAGVGVRTARAVDEDAYQRIGRTTQNNFRKYQGRRTERLLNRIVWLDFNDPKAKITKVDTIRDQYNDRRRALRVGSTYSRQWGDYRIEATVTELKPFQSTEIFRQRAQQAQAETGYNYTQYYEPDATNSTRRYIQHYYHGVEGVEKHYPQKETKPDAAKARIVIAPQDRFSAMKALGLPVPGDVTLRSAWDGANVGLKLNVKSWYKGEEVKPNIVMADGEEAAPTERLFFTTDGKPWELMTELSSNSTIESYRPLTHNFLTVYDDWDYPSRLWNNVLPDANAPSEQRIQDGVPRKGTTRDSALRNVDPITGDGIGTQVFGPVSTHITSRYSVPIVMTRDASNVGMYINTAGRQSGMIGLLFFDQGDAPDSYQPAAHLLRSDGDRSANPYLGDTPPDLDLHGIDGDGPAWTNDDISDQPDEGERQLTGGANNGRYAVHLSTDPSYSLKVLANVSQKQYNEANVKGWVDANNNGRFDDGEGSDTIRVTADRNGRSKTITLPFSSLQPNIDPSVTRLGARVRIATNANDIRDPGGVAYSGEVEDFQIQQIHPPRGSYAETTGPQGQPQTSTVHFNAYGELQYTTTPNAIDDTKDAWIVGADGGKAKLDNNGYYVVKGEGKYRVSGRGSDITVDFVPEPQYVGRARGIVIRSTDRNGNDTGWKVPAGAVGGVTPITSIDTMDSEYIPTVTPSEATLTLVQGVDNTYAGRYGIDPEGWTLSAPRADGQAGGIDPKPADGAFAPDGAVVRKTSGTTKLAPGRYTLTQQPNANYRKDGRSYPYRDAYAAGDWSCTDEQGQRVTVGADHAVELSGQMHITCVVTDKARSGAVIWNKVDASDRSQLLAGSVWSLTSTDVPGFADMTVTDNGAGDTNGGSGSLRVAPLSWGEYKLRETQAPSGYAQSDKQWTVRVLPVDEQGKPADTDTFGLVITAGERGVVPNTKVADGLFALPLTGGRTGREWLALGIGLLTMAAAAIAGYAVMRRRQQHDLGLAAGR